MAASSAFSPECPKGGWPRSCTSASASTRSIFKPSCAAMVREICATSMRMGQTIAEVVRIAAGENLGLRFKPAKSSGVNDAITVPLKVVAIRMWRLGITASAGVVQPAPRSRPAYRSLAPAMFKLKSAATPACQRTTLDCELFRALFLREFHLRRLQFFLNPPGSAGSTSAAMVRFHSSKPAPSELQPASSVPSSGKDPPR